METIEQAAARLLARKNAMTDARGLGRHYGYALMRYWTDRTDEPYSAQLELNGASWSADGATPTEAVDRCIASIGHVITPDDFARAIGLEVAA